MGYKFAADPSAEWDIYKELDGHPRYEALKRDGFEKINATREELGLEPLEA